VLGFLYDKSLTLLVALSVAVTLAALIPLTMAIKAHRGKTHSPLT
jgi:hypothetical protein